MVGDEFMCGKCNRTYRTKEELDDHSKVCDGGIQCWGCDTVFYSVDLYVEGWLQLYSRLK